MALRPLFPFQLAQYVQVFSLKPAPFCTLFAGLGITNKPATFLLLLSDYRSVLATLSSPPSFLLPETLWQIWQISPPVLSDHNESPDTRFSRGTTRLTSWPGRERYSRLLQSLVVSLLLSLVIYSCLFWDWRRTVSSKFFDTQVSSISTEELVLPRHARCVLSRLRCNGHSLLLSSSLSRIGRIENPSCSACVHSSQDISHLILHCPQQQQQHENRALTPSFAETSNSFPLNVTFSVVDE